MKPNLQLASFLKELLAEYDEAGRDEILKNLSQKWNIEPEDIEFYLEAINSYYYRPIFSNMVASATYDENFMEVFRAMDYLNGKIDENGNLKATQKTKGFIFRLLKNNFKWIFIIVFTLVFIALVRLIIYLLSSLFG